MCFSAYAQYAPRPVKANGGGGPSPTVATALAQDPNIFGHLAEATAPHHHDHAAAPSTTQAGSATVQSVVVTMPDGRRFMITPLD